VGAGADGLADYFLGVTEAVDGGGVNPVDALVEGGMDGADGVGVVLRAPCEVPVAAADGPSAKG